MGIAHQRLRNEDPALNCGVLVVTPRITLRGPHRYSGFFAT